MTTVVIKITALHAGVMDPPRRAPRQSTRVCSARSRGGITLEERHSLPFEAPFSPPAVFAVVTSYQIPTGLYRRSPRVTTKPKRDGYVDITQPGLSFATPKGGIKRGASEFDAIMAATSASPIAATNQPGVPAPLPRTYVSTDARPTTATAAAKRRHSTGSMRDALVDSGVESFACSTKRLASSSSEDNFCRELLDADIYGPPHSEAAGTQSSVRLRASAMRNDTRFAIGGAVGTGVLGSEPDQVENVADNQIEEQKCRIKANNVSVTRRQRKRRASAAVVVAAIKSVVHSAGPLQRDGISSAATAEEDRTVARTLAEDHHQEQEDDKEEDEEDIPVSQLRLRHLLLRSPKKMKRLETDARAERVDSDDEVPIVDLKLKHKKTCASAKDLSAKLPPTTDSVGGPPPGPIANPKGDADEHPNAEWKHLNRTKDVRVGTLLLKQTESFDEQQVTKQPDGCPVDLSSPMVNAGIYGKRLSECGGTEYLVRWEGYEKNEASWEVAERLGSVAHDIEQFERRLQAAQALANAGPSPTLVPTQVLANPTVASLAAASDPVAPPTAPSPQVHCGSIVSDSDDDLPMQRLRHKLSSHGDSSCLEEDSVDVYTGADPHMVWNIPMQPAIQPLIEADDVNSDQQDELEPQPLPPQQISRRENQSVEICASREGIASTPASLEVRRERAVVNQDPQSLCRSDREAEIATDIMEQVSPGV